MAIPLFSATNVLSVRTAAIDAMVALGHTPNRHWVSVDLADVFKAKVFYCACLSCFCRIYVHVDTLTYNGQAVTHRCGIGEAYTMPITLISGYDEI